MDKVTKIVFFLTLFFLAFLIEIKKVRAENDNSKLEYLEQLIEKKALFVSDSFDISTIYVTLGMATLLMKDSCEEKQIQGYELLDKIAFLIEDRIKNKIITTDDKNIELILKMLGHHKYFINVPVSDSEKLVRYVKQGKFNYILQRGHERGIYKYIALAIGSFFISIWFFYRKKKKKL